MFVMLRWCQVCQQQAMYVRMSVVVRRSGQPRPSRLSVPACPWQAWFSERLAPREHHSVTMIRPAGLVVVWWVRT